MFKSTDALWRYIDMVAKEKVGDVNTSEVGTIKSIDGSLLTVEIGCMGITVVDLPFFTLQGGGSYIQFPISIGDDCIVIFNKHNNDSWYEGVDAPANPTFNVSNGIVLVGANASGKPIDIPDHTRLFVDKIEVTDGSEDVISLISDLMELLSKTIDQHGKTLDVIAGLTTSNGGTLSASASPAFLPIKTLYDQSKTDLDSIKTKYDKFKI